ncbi:MAG: hypothetical protein AB3N23_22305 [Paracoccaceae bacterium]
MIKAAALLLLTASPGSAGAWQAFEARCLMPFEAFGPPVVGDLAQRAQAGYETSYDLPEGGVLVVEAAPEDGHAACRVHHDRAQGEDAGFEAWMTGVTAIERYIETDASNAGLLELHSNLWAEPVIAVQAQWTATGGIYRVIETELEA